MKEGKIIMGIIIPCFNEEAVIEETARQLSEILVELITEKLISENSFILFSNDGSKDKTWSIIENMYHNNSLIAGLKLSHNVGHQNALVAGLEVAVKNADVIVTIDADLQDDVLAIKKMVLDYLKGNDVVYGVRSERKKDTIFKKYSALFFYKLMSFLGTQTIYNHADFRLMSKRAVEHLLLFRERNLFLRGIVPLIGFKSSKIYYERKERYAGDTKYTFGKMLNFAIEGVTSFSIKPLRIIFVIGFIFLFLTIITGFYILYQYFHHNVVSGWSSLILSVWLIGSIVIISLGIIGEYIGKIYTEVKDRPRYNIETILIRKKE